MNFYNWACCGPSFMRDTSIATELHQLALTFTFVNFRVILGQYVMTKHGMKQKLMFYVNKWVIQKLQNIKTHL